MSRHAATVAVFLVAAALVYLVGWGLLAAWRVGAMLGFGGPAVFLVAALLVAGLAAIGASFLGGRPAVRGGAGDTLTAAERCPACRAPIEPDYVLCPSCHRPLGTRCPACARPLQPGWTRCPYCAAAVTPVDDGARPGADDAGAATRLPGEDEVGQRRA